MKIKTQMNSHTSHTSELMCNLWKVQIISESQLKLLATATSKKNALTMCFTE